MPGVPRPDHVHALYAVMSANPIDPPGDAPLPDERLLRLRGASADQIEDLRTRPCQHVVSDTAELQQAVQMQRRTRTHAIAIASEHDGIVLDLQIPAVVPLESDPTLTAALWIGFDYDRIGDGEITVLGLEAFGLPPAVIDHVDPDHHAMYTALATGLAQRFIDEWPAHDPLGGATVTLRDIAYGLGDAQAETTPADRGACVDISFDGERLHVTTTDDLAQTLFR